MKLLSSQSSFFFFLHLWNHKLATSQITKQAQVTHHKAMEFKAANNDKDCVIPVQPTDPTLPPAAVPAAPDQGPAPPDHFALASWKSNVYT